MIVGFAMAAYSIIANDSIQTLGTFLTSNAKRPWWILWIWISSILVITVMWGWMSNDGDPAFGRLAAKNIELPLAYNFLFIIPPLVLLLLTRFGIPCSTSLLVLTAYTSLLAVQVDGNASLFAEPAEFFTKMVKKSVSGYLLALAVGLVAYIAVVAVLEKKFKANPEAGIDKPAIGWIVFQWLSTGFLWSMWLVQDLANVFVYLPRKLDIWSILIALTGMVLLQGFLIRGKGGKIQNIVKEKSNTVDVRSATFIDLFYGLVLLFFKVDYIPTLFEQMGWEIPWPPKMPMSTTWVFLGLLAGREIGMWLRTRHIASQEVGGAIGRDLKKVLFGTAVSVVIAFLLPYLAILFGYAGTAMPETGEVPVVQVDDSQPNSDSLFASQQLGSGANSEAATFTSELAVGDR